MCFSLNLFTWCTNIFFLSGCVGIFCPCYLFGSNAEALGSGTLMGSCMMHFILWALVNTVCCMLTEGVMLGLPGCFVACYACGYRRTLRGNYNLEVYLHLVCTFMLFWYLCSIDVDEIDCLSGIKEHLCSLSFLVIVSLRCS